MAAPKKPATDAQPKQYYIVNPKGCIHEVDREHAAWRLIQIGYRLAKPEEIAALNSPRGGMAPGEQRFEQPIATPWSPDPDQQLDI